MKRLIVLSVVVLVIIGGWLLSNNKTPAPATNNLPSQSSKSTQASANNTVTIQNFAFTPANLTVKKGTTVTWTNQDAVEHTVTETDGQKGPNAAPLSQGQSYSFSYNEAGTFHYHCSIHSEMTGIVTVTAS